MTSRWRYGFIDESGQWVIPPTYSAANAFGSGLAPVAMDNFKWGFIDRNGETVIPGTYQLAYGFEQGTAQVQRKNQWGLINTAGEEVVPIQYYGVTNLEKDVYAAQVTMYDPWFILDRQGTRSARKALARYVIFDEGLAPARNEDELWGFVNTSGEWVIEPAYTDAFSFSEVWPRLKWNMPIGGFIDRTGKMIIEPQYDRGTLFRNGFAVAERGLEFLVINKANQVQFTFSR